MAQTMQSNLGQPVVVENRGGAAGVIATEAITAAQPNDHTIGIGMTSTLAVNPHVYRMRAGVMKDFAHIGSIAKMPIVLLAQHDLVEGGLAGFITRVGAKADTITDGSVGAGCNVHIGMFAFLEAAWLKMMHQPYRGSEPMVIDLVAGDSQSGMTGAPAALPLLRAGRVAALGTAAKERLAQTPDTRAISETIPRFEAVQW